MNSSRITANGVSFEVLQAGSGKLALCLHGFPDNAHSMAPLLHALAGAGYHAVAPFMRGYAPSSVPADGRFQTAVLGQDALALIEALGAEEAVVIGHDWGATAAYAAAVINPARVRRLVTLAVPYGNGLIMRLIGDPVQQRRSWYMYLLTSPLGEMALSYGDFGLIDRLWADWSPGFEAPVGHLESVKASLRAPGAAGAAASYYKHVFMRELQDPGLAEAQARIGGSVITVPALYLHGADDGCIGAEVETERDLFTSGVEIHIVAGAGHFLHLEKPDEVNEIILRFLGK
jgi:pimeloyl-ACP methyl ester carboxylesterase